MGPSLVATLNSIKADAELWAEQAQPVLECADKILASSLTDKNLALPGTASYWDTYAEVQAMLADLSASAAREFTEVSDALKNNVAGYARNEAESSEHIQGGY